MWEAVSDGRTSCSEFHLAARRAPPTFNGLFVRDRIYEIEYKITDPNYGGKLQIRVDRCRKARRPPLFSHRRYCQILQEISLPALPSLMNLFMVALMVISIVRRSYSIVTFQLKRWGIYSARGRGSLRTTLEAVRRRPWSGRTH